MQMYRLIGFRENLFYAFHQSIIVTPNPPTKQKEYVYGLTRSTKQSLDELISYYVDI